MPNVRKVPAAVVLACTLAGASAAFAQSGSIAGQVKDPSGAILPGVTVEVSSPVLIEKVRTATTDGQGNYKIIELRPGTYSVLFTLPGFNTLKREGIVLTSDFTATVSVELRVGAVEETVTVTAESPLIDTQSVTQRKSLTHELIDALPTGRSFQNLSVLVPGVQIALGSQDVGGTGGDRYQTLSVHGSRADQMPLVMNGMPFNNMNNTGGGYNTTLVVNTGTVQEMAVTTSGLTAESRSSGVLTNIVAKEGGNSYHGYLFTNFTNTSLQSSNLTQDLIDRGLKAVNRVNKLWDVNPVIGGPIIKDKLWFLGGFRYNGAQNYLAGMFTNLRPGAPQYCSSAAGCSYGDASHPVTLVPNSQDLGNQAIGGDTWTRGETANLTWQATQRNKFTFYSHFNQRLVDCNQCSATNSPEAGVYFTHSPEYLLQSTWTNPMTNKLLFEGGFTFYNETWIFGPEPYNINGLVPDAVVSKTESSLGMLYGAANVFTTAANHQYNMRFATNYVTGSHAFRVGMQDMWGTRNYRYDTNQAQAWTFLRGIPTTITEYARPLIDTEHLKSALGIYAQDRWTVDRLTLNLGVRFDYHNAYVPAQDLAAIPFVAARQYDPITNVPSWKDLSPRIGATFDLFGNGKTVARGNIGRYVASESTNMATLNNRVNTSINAASRSWTDSNGNFLPDCNLSNPALNGECGQLNQPLGSLNVAAQYDPSITGGFGVRPNDREVSAGVQQQLHPRVAVDFQYTRHAFGNFIASQDINHPPATSFSSFCVTAPPDPRLPGGGGNQICGFQDQNPNTFATLPFYAVQKARTFGDVSDIYTGYDFNATARLPRGGFVSGGTSIGHEVTDICGAAGSVLVGYAPVAGVLASSSGTLLPFGSTAVAGAATTPSTLYCHVEPPFQADVKAAASYPLPWFGLQASATLQNRPGPQVLARYTVTSAQVQNLNRPLGLGTAAAQLIAPGTMYGDRLNQLDVRFGKMFRAARGSRIQVSADIFNVLNSSAILSLNTTYGTSWLSPTQILQGRLVKFGAQIDF
ncbi:MAG TPA: carboxypeptidase regulatory-like domain-containing protein [Vicinamibacterales bacterium]|nr:carboxypeptidase regulatory-like domain-containing protein [Vicinamibacterales bacterium]